MLEICFVPMKLLHIVSNTWFETKDIGKDTTKPLFFNFIVQNETYTCIFCNSWFFEFRCGVRIFTIIGHMSSPRYSHLVVHVGLHNHPSAKGEN
jgi:hypothetical protein